MPVISRLDSSSTHGYQARVHDHCGKCLRPWCACHRKATRFFADAKHGGKRAALMLARQWCEGVKKANAKAAGSKRKALLRIYP